MESKKFPEFNKKEIIKVAFLLFDHVEALDLNGPIDIFVKANFFDKRFELFTVSANEDPVYSEGKVLQMKATYNFLNAPQADIIVIPGAEPSLVKKIANNNTEISQWIKKQHQKATLTFSVCTGSVILAATGILENKMATTHFGVMEYLKQYKSINTIENVRYVLDGKVLTTAGITSGLDGALYVIEEILGKEIADNISNILVYNRDADLSFMNNK